MSLTKTNLRNLVSSLGDLSNPAVADVSAKVEAVLQEKSPKVSDFRNLLDDLRSNQGKVYSQAADGIEAMLLAYAQKERERKAKALEAKGEGVESKPKPKQKSTPPKTESTVPKSNQKPVEPPKTEVPVKKAPTVAPAPSKPKEPVISAPKPVTTPVVKPTQPVSTVNPSKSSPQGARQNGLRIVKTLVASKSENEKAKIVGYIIEKKGTGVKKGFTVEESAELVYKYGADNIEVAVRSPKKDANGNDIGEASLYIRAVGNKPDGTPYSLRDRTLVLPSLNKEGKPWCPYSPTLTTLTARSKRQPSGNTTELAAKRAAEEKARKHAQISALIAKKNIGKVGF